MPAQLVFKLYVSVTCPKCIKVVFEFVWGISRAVKLGLTVVVGRR